MIVTLGARLVLLLLVTLSAACTDTKQDFCKYLSLDEAREFDPAITTAEMRQTKRILYCVWKDGASDKLFISLDRALDYHPRDFLKVLAKNSPEENDEVVSVPGVGDQAAALFLGDGGNWKLEFFIAQNREYAVTIRAPDITTSRSEKFNKLKDVASTVLSRL